MTLLATLKRLALIGVLVGMVTLGWLPRSALCAGTDGHVAIEPAGTKCHVRWHATLDDGSWLVANADSACFDADLAGPAIVSGARYHDDYSASKLPAGHGPMRHCFRAGCSAVQSLIAERVRPRRPALLSCILLI